MLLVAATTASPLGPDMTDERTSLDAVPLVAFDAIEEAVHVMEPVFAADDPDTIVDLRLLRTNAAAAREEYAGEFRIGSLASEHFVDARAAMAAAQTAWISGWAPPYQVRRAAGCSGADDLHIAVTTLRVNDHIVQISADRSATVALEQSEALLASVVQAIDASTVVFRPHLEGDRVTDLEVVWRNPAAERLWARHGVEIGQRATTTLDTRPDDLNHLLGAANTAWLTGSHTDAVRVLDDDVPLGSVTLHRVDDFLVEFSVDLSRQVDMLHLHSRTLDALSDGVLVFRPFVENGRFIDAQLLYANDVAFRQFQSPWGEQPVGHWLSEVGDAPSGFGQRLLQAHEGETTTIDIADSMAEPFAQIGHGTITYLPLPDGTVAVVVRDLTEQVAAALDRERARTMEDAVLDAIKDPVAVWRLDDAGEPVCVRVNEAGEAWLPHPAPVALDDVDLLPATRAKVRAGVLHAIRENEAVTQFITYEGPDPSADSMGVRMTHLPLPGDNAMTVLLDLTNEVREMVRIRISNELDPETELFNVGAFEAAVSRMLEANGHRVAVIAIALDQIDTTERAVGPAAAARMMRAAATRINATLTPSIVAGRIAASTLAVAMPLETTPGEQFEVASALLERVGRPIDVDGTVLHLDATAGLALAPTHGSDATTLVMRARSAAFEARTSGMEVLVWHPSFDRSEHRHAELLADIERGIAADEFEMEYQAEVDRDGRFFGAEALVRWNHPTRGLVHPGEFIALLENSTLVRRFTDQVLRRTMRDWTAAAMPGRVSVNVPAALMSDPNLYETVTAALRDTGMAPTSLCIEVTERGLVASSRIVIENITRLRIHGVWVLLDDFGTGSTSLSYLRQLNVDALKLDRIFIDGIRNDPVNRAIVSGVVSMAHAVDMQVIAEGAEHPDDLAASIELGCSVVQGYAITPPLSLTALCDRARSAGLLDR